MTTEKPNTIYLGIALRASGIADVERFFHGLKFVAGFTAVFIMASTLIYFFQPYEKNDEAGTYDQDQEMSAWEDRAYFLGYFGYGYLWGHHESWQRTYLKGCVQDESYGCTKDTTPFQFMMLQMKRHPRTYFDICIFFLGWGCLSFGYFFLRRPAPVRFNRNLGAIYTWHRGKLWIHPLYIFDYSCQLSRDVWNGGGFNGPMDIKLRSSQNLKKRKTFRLGIYPFPGDEYGLFLGEILHEFMLGTYEDSERGWPKNLKYRWWHRSLFGRKKLPDDIDQRAEEWLRSQHQKTH
ncbi:hypothetical protein [Thalassospira sp. TSL5-1]|uniref:hypothetical protein n=1 Tax=Thalassospira sp. TSL5-1 TaxID=1544451 RepID=UPI00093C8BB4|nr:hypothetical protein [Thalassospira sp. TSL5-1]OKH86437.1 hypothetical protein LF95_22785 [Thalassospira sp. TSL5-1]